MLAITGVVVFSRLAATRAVAAGNDLAAPSRRHPRRRRAEGRRTGRTTASRRSAAPRGRGRRYPSWRQGTDRFFPDVPRVAARRDFDHATTSQALFGVWMGELNIRHGPTRASGPWVIVGIYPAPHNEKKENESNAHNSNVHRENLGRWD